MYIEYSERQIKSLFEGKENLMELYSSEGLLGMPLKSISVRKSSKTNS